MSEKKYQPPPSAPPSYRRAQSGYDGQDNRQQDQSAQQQRASWTVGGGPSTQSSNNPYREPHLGIPQGLRPSSINVPNTASRDKEQFQPPPGPPPGHQDVNMDDEQYSPPVGPPPGHTTHGFPSTPSPAPLPTPSSGEADIAPPEYDPWTGADDRLSLPPSFSASMADQRSPAANADFDDAKRAHAWCAETPLWTAHEHPAMLVSRIDAGDLRLTVPPNTTDVTQYQPAMGTSYVRTGSGISDTILLSDVPIYAAQHHTPLATGQQRTIYFEVKIMGMGDRYGTGKNVESGIAIGFVAPPYPAWRLPGWHRGSLGVHSDDGRRYVDNSYGGVEFVPSFGKGDVVGIGMTFHPPIHGDRITTRCDVFFTRNGKREKGWDLHEEQPKNVDAGDIGGLEGEHDLLAAVGVFGSVEFECIFNQENWLFKG
ncbi:hypothetical protein AC578_9217 [Pseudocercospora eumusae]|uniref:SPRY domain-containing protein n=1 Tax=Pseudocercospora eumusae TaxID=321146 RepID=A0A139GV49_9PEZI|nr:hypothetical protein AC578_9217 [Pseudocercospora eumusae]